MKASVFHRLARSEVSSLPPYNAGLSSDAVRARYGATEIARLGSNESAFGASPAVGRAVADTLAQTSLYPDASCTALRRTIAHVCGAEPGEVIVGNGSEDILQMICLALLSPGDRVLVQRPGFGLHEIFPSMMGAQLDVLALSAALEFDLGAWCHALARSPKIAMIANPSNPVGCMFDAKAFDRLLAATSAETLLVIDEAYYEYACLEDGFPDALAALRAQQRPWIVLRTLSKAWGLAGLRVGYGIASDAALVQLLDKVRTPFNVSHVAQTAALAALGDEGFMVHAATETVKYRRALAIKLQEAALPGLRLAPSFANFLFIDLGRPNVPVTEALLKRGIIVKPWKESGYENFIRVSTGTPHENERLVHALMEIFAAPNPHPAL